MAKVWFDVSGIYSWSGNFTGIQRIVYNLAKELNESTTEAGYFIHNGRGFSEISFAVLEQRLEELSKAEDPSKLIKTNGSLSTLRHHTILGLKSAFRGTKAEPALRTAYGTARGTYRKVRSIKGHKLPTIFQQGDIVVVVDGNWQFKDYADNIVNEKKRYRFKLVHFVHDLTAIKNPALASPGANTIITGYFEKIFEAADLLIAISDSTKRDIEEFLIKSKFNNNPKIKTLIMGDNMSTQGIKPQKPNGYRLPDKYILAVSTIEVRKNYLSLYYAYKLAIQQQLSPPHLVIVGKKGWMADEVYSLLTKDPEIKSRVTILHGISDQELDWLYKNCLFTVFPSFYEGWGLPIIESFAYGKACICSNTSSLPEAGRDLAVYVSPYDTSELLSAIMRLSEENDERISIESRIKTEYKRQTWQHAFEELEKILESL